MESLADGVDLSEPLTRARFEELVGDLLKKTLGPVKKVLLQTGICGAKLCCRMLCMCRSTSAMPLMLEGNCKQCASCFKSQACLDTRGAEQSVVPLHRRWMTPT